jgi:hypothetical protein
MCHLWFYFDEVQSSANMNWLPCRQVKKKNPEGEDVWMINRPPRTTTHASEVGAADDSYERDLQVVITKHLFISLPLSLSN